MDKIVVGYVRVSTENQRENYSIDEQINRITAYCKAKDWILTKIYTDGGYSGGNTNRPALNQLLMDINTTKINGIIVYRLDRLSRSQKDTLTLIEDNFISKEIDFISISENFDTSTPFGRAMIGILSVFAQLEKDQIVERFTMGRIGRSKEGLYHGGGIIPTGYNYKNGLLVVDEFESQKVVEIYNLFLEGKSINAIYKHMSQKYTEKWSVSKIRYILTNPLYMGKVRFANTEYTGKHAPLINAQTFNTTQKYLKSKEEKTPFRANHLLSSLIYCGNCNAKYSANHGYYKCYSRSKASKKFITNPNCKNHNWEISKLDNIILTSITNIFNPTILNQLNYNPQTIDKNKIDNYLKSIEKQTSNLIDLYQIDSIPLDILKEKLNNLEKKREILESTLKESSISTNISFADALLTANTPIKRILVNSLIHKITINAQNIEIHWKV